jgi:DNA-binding NarL/FixJ family response regulator
MSPGCVRTASNAMQATLVSAIPRFKPEIPRNGSNGTAASGQQPAQKQIRVVLVSPVRLMRECLTHLLESVAPDFAVVPVAELAQAEPAPPAFAPATAVVVVVYVLPSRTHATKAMLRRHLSQVRDSFTSPVPVLFLSQDEDTPDEAVAAVQLGAKGFFPPSLSADLLTAAIRLVASGGVFVSPDTGRTLLRS